jgi:hypothetical protein
MEEEHKKIVANLLGGQSISMNQEHFLNHILIATPYKVSVNH